MLLTLCLCKLADCIVYQLRGGGHVLVMYYTLVHTQHPFVTDFSDRQVRIQIKDQIDRMKRKKQLDEYEWSGSEDEGSSLDPPTVKKHGEGVCVCVCTTS